MTTNTKQLVVEVYKNSDLKQLLDATNVPSGMMMVEGVFAKVDSVNRNKRSYPREEYAKHIGLMQQRITESNGILGELEHPKSMNIDLNNISHKVMSIRLDEDNFVRGTIMLLDTPKGLIAQSVVKSGSPLPVSSRAVGNVSESGSVSLDFMSTFDLVGTSGFQEASTYQISESLDADGKCIMETYAYDINESGDVVDKSNLQLIIEAVKAEFSKSYVHVDKVEELISERLSAMNISEMVNENATTGNLSESAIVALMDKRFVNEYSPIIENWTTQEFAPSIGNSIQEWLTNDYAQVLESWIVKDVLVENAEHTQSWLTNEFAPKFGQTIQEWLVNDYSPTIQEWLVNDYSPTVQEWLVNDYAEANQKWLTEHFAPNVTETATTWLTESYGSILENTGGTGMVNESVDFKNISKDDLSKGKSVRVLMGNPSSKGNYKNAKLLSDKSDKNDMYEIELSDSGKKTVMPLGMIFINELKGSDTDLGTPILEHAELFASKLLDNVDALINEAKAIVTEPKPAPVQIDESHFQHAPAWLKKIPQANKAIWQAMNESQRSEIYKRASVRIMETNSDVERFWNSIDFQTIIESKGTKIPSMSRALNENFVIPNDANPRMSISSFAKALRG